VYCHDSKKDRQQERQHHQGWQEKKQGQQKAMAREMTAHNSRRETAIKTDRQQYATEH